MSPADLTLWLRVQRRAAVEYPDLLSALFRAYVYIRLSLTDAQIARVVSSGNVDELYSRVLTQAMLDQAFGPVRERIRTSVGKGVIYAARDLPKPIPPAPTIKFAFDVLNPRVIDGIRTLETKVITGLQDDVRETVRAVVENGLRDGAGAARIGRDIRGMVGLGPAQEQQVRNFRAALMGQEGRNPLGYVLRDKRFDRTLAKGPLSEAQVDKMVAAYSKRRIAQNADTVARTASLDSFKLGQHLSMADAVDRGIYDGSRLMKQWRGVLDDRERDSHLEMQDDTVGWDQPYSNGEMYCGEGEFNCRCISRYFTPAASAS